MAVVGEKLPHTNFTWKDEGHEGAELRVTVLIPGRKGDVG